MIPGAHKCAPYESLTELVGAPFMASSNAKSA